MAHVLRAPQLDLAAVLSSQNPQIDLRLSAYDSSTRNFLKAVSSYTNRAIDEITRRRNTHASEQKKITERKQHMEAETTICKVKEIDLISVLEAEQAEKKEAESSVVAFKRQLSSIKEKCAAIDVEIEQYRAITTNLRREKNREHSILDNHALRTTPELTVIEHRLRCVVEGVDKDKLLVRFTHIDRSDLDREFSVVIDVSNRIYKVPTSTPVLPTLPILIDQLNETRDVYVFIKQVRHAFQEITGR